MLAIFLFHYVRSDGSPWSTPPSQLFQNLKNLANQRKTVHSGEPSPEGTHAISLSFDDASYCFYHYVFPFLKENHFKAILAVPTAFILEQTMDLPEHRLKPRPDILLNQSPSPSSAFCTWEEIRIMQASGLVEIASHTCTHANLNRSETDIAYECEQSALEIEKQTAVCPRTLVLPFGRGNPKVIQKACEFYRYVLRIGNAWNHGWEDSSPLYRTPSDNLTPHQLPQPGSFSGWANHYWNRLRGK